MANIKLTNDYWEASGVYDITYGNGKTQRQINSDLNGAITYPTTEALKKKNIVCIGDSYLQGYTPSGDINGWGAVLKSLLSLPNAQYQSNYLGGTGFCNTRDSKKFQDLLEDSSITNKDKVDCLIICGGYNDREYTMAQIDTGINSAVTSALSLYPNAMIYIGFCGISSTPDDYRKCVDACLKYQRTVNNIVNSRVKYLTWLEHSIFRKSHMSSDGFHPAQEGQNRIARGIIRCITTGINRFNEFIDTTYADGYVTDPTNYTSTDASKRLVVQINNGNILFIKTNAVLTLNSGVTPSTATFNQYAQVLFYCDEFLPLINTQYSENQSLLMTGQVQDTDTSTATYYSFTGNLRMSATGGMVIQLSLINDAGTNYKHGYFKVLTVPQFKMRIPMFTN